MKPTITPAAMRALAEGDLGNFLTASTPGGIEAQEAAGQRDLVAQANKLPKMMYGCDRSDFESLGFVFHNDIDDVFVGVTFAEGWKLQATDHSMWSDLIDETVNVRFHVFYKAAFYDRNGHVIPVKRSV